MENTTNIHMWGHDPKRRSKDTIVREIASTCNVKVLDILPLTVKDMKYLAKHLVQQGLVFDYSTRAGLLTPLKAALPKITSFNKLSLMQLTTLAHALENYNDH